MSVQEVATELEWELFARPRVLHGLNGSGLPEGMEMIELRRDDGYAITASFLGHIRTGSPGSMPMSPVGTPVTGTEVRGTDEGYSEVVLSGVHVTEMGMAHLGPMRGRITGTLSVQHAFASRGSDARPTALVEWYLNGPVERALFFRPTRRDSEVSFRRRRDPGSSGPSSPAVINRSSSDTSVDHAQIDVGLYRFIVAAVPHGYGPLWSQSLSIEYRTELGAIPDEPTREAISEAVSFVLGRQLLPIGLTEMDDESVPIFAEARSPWGDGVEDQCTKPSVPPVHIYDIFDRPFESVASSVVRAYLANREVFGLKGAMWNYWLARRAPIGPNLVFIAAAMESLMKGWFESGRSPSSGLAMSQQEFELLLEPELESVRHKLAPHPQGARTAGRIRRAYVMGVNERFEAFFEELGITLTPLEATALRRRNISAHGGGVAGEARRLAEHLQIMEETQNTHMQYLAYETLFHRVVLTLLGHRGTYVDYTTIDHPSRDIMTHVVVPRPSF